ncbi:MAG: DNA polymerase III subunit beta [Alphaproteobacteria bacterium]|nr:DNA polymerase III subunit beta [Alphaproteobacteria bacterium]
MKLTIERATLLRALGHVQSIVERRNTIPILSNVMLDARDDALSLTATDMDIAIVEKISADVTTAGATTTSAHTLYDIVRKLPEGAQVALEKDAGAGQINLAAGRARFRLGTLDTAEFPAMADGELPNRFTVSAGDFRALIDRTRFAISTEETRYYLNGIYMHAVSGDGGDRLRAVATDGHRLARVEMPLPEGAAGMPGVIIPRKTVNELRKLIDETGGDVDVALSDTKIRFAFDDAVLTSKLIDGTFPDYERVIPVGNDKMMIVDRKEFAGAVDLVATIATEKSRAIKLAVEGRNLALSATSPDAGSAEEELEADYDGDAISIGFNSRYLLDITQQIEGDKAQFIMADSNSPTIVRDAGDDSALYVLMPMRV